MDIKIGIKSVNRELNLEVEEEESVLIARINRALQEASPLEITDKRGAKYVIPSDALGYLEISEAKAARVGFTL